MTKMIIGIFILLAYIFWASYLFSSAYASEPIKVAIIDTGLNLSDPRFTPVLCPEGHADLSGEGSIVDSNGHGTHIAGLIKAYAGDSNYCLLIFKYFSPKHTSSILDSLRLAIAKGATIINVSAGGKEYSESEYLALKYAPGVTVIAAAGNDGKENVNWFPSSYPLPNVLSVGSTDAKGVRAATSNYGVRVKTWEVGEYVYSTFPDGGSGYMSGTSQAAAIHTGKLIKERSNASH